MNRPDLQAFPLRTHDKVRYADTDRQGHVNNASFSSFLETGRVECLYNEGLPILKPGASFVIASLNLNFLKEINWPGQVDIGAGVLKIGNASIRLYQQLFQGSVCVATAETVIVQVDNHSGGSTPLSDTAREVLAQWLIDLG
ncbi:MAG: thioesterase family protein [Bacteroidia bacterium]